MQRLNPLRILVDARNNLAMRMRTAMMRHYFSPGRIQYVTMAEHEAQQQRLADEAHFFFVVEPLISFAVVTVLSLGTAIWISLDWSNFVAQANHSPLCIGMTLALLVVAPVGEFFSLYVLRR
jgi:hypothetical protein